MFWRPGPMLGRVCVSSTVKKEENWALRISDLSLGSEWLVPSFFSGSTPELSLFMFLAYE